MHPDARLLYGERFDFAVEGLGIDEMAAGDFDAAQVRIETAARHLGSRGASAIALLGTSFSFYRGAAFNAALERRMQDAAGCPAVSATSAMVWALAGARRVAVGAAYDEEMSRRLQRYLEEAGFHVAALARMNLRSVSAAIAVRDQALLDLAAEACAAARGADALLLACGAFATAHLLPALEERHGMRAVSSTAAALHAAVRVTGPYNAS